MLPQYARSVFIEVHCDKEWKCENKTRDACSDSLPGWRLGSWIKTGLAGYIFFLYLTAFIVTMSRDFLVSQYGNAEIEVLKG